MTGVYSRPTETPKSLDQVADVIYRSLESALSQRCAELYDMDVTCTDSELPMEIQVQCKGRLGMHLQVTVEHVGGNVYDVFCTIEEGASCQLTYGYPEDAGTPLPLCPRLGRKCAAFVLDELEQRLGRWHLRGEAG
ncbi:MAG: hypothetical protein V5A20_05435 [Salinibacter sp.]|uniref:hypothetical protein n=1 Tax=Salinibacter sp. TaxID=2065818 RepID=UPI002FC283E8